MSTTTTTAAAALLPPDALCGLRVGLSVSESADLARLGLMEPHFRLALRELARTVLVGGGTLTYSGHLVPGGYTEFLIDELHRYASTGLLDAAGRPHDTAPLVCLAWQEHRKRDLAKLAQADEALGLHGELRCLDLDGNAVDCAAGRGEARRVVSAGQGAGGAQAHRPTAAHDGRDGGSGAAWRQAARLHRRHAGGAGGGAARAAR